MEENANAIDRHPRQLDGAHIYLYDRFPLVARFQAAAHPQGLRMRLLLAGQKSATEPLVWLANLRIDLSGRRFGRLIAIRLVGSNRSGGLKWECSSYCNGKTTVMSSGNLPGQNTNPANIFNAMDQERLSCCSVRQTENRKRKLEAGPNYRSPQRIELELGAPFVMRSMARAFDASPKKTFRQEAAKSVRQNYGERFVVRQNTPLKLTSSMTSSKPERTEQRLGPGRPGQARYFRLAVRLKVPVGEWLKLTARSQKLSMSRLLEEIVEAEMVRVGPPEEGPQS